MASVVINYCSNERIFLDAVLRESMIFSKDIVVSYGSNLYDGTPEDIEHIIEYKKKYPTIQFVEYNVDISLDIKKRKGVINRPTSFWHNKARWIGIQALKNKEWVFIIDCDEIPDGNRVLEFLSFDILDKKECYKFANYWYFKSPENQATTIEDSVLLIHSKYLTEENIFGDNERDFLIPASGTELHRQIMGIDNKPMFHHYSGCRTKEGMRHKLKHWGHADDIYKGINANKIIEYIYKNNDVNDVIHNYQYIKVPNKFNIVI